MHSLLLLGLASPHEINPYYLYWSGPRAHATALDVIEFDQTGNFSLLRGPPAVIPESIKHPHMMPPLPTHPLTSHEYERFLKENRAVWHPKDKVWKINGNPIAVDTHVEPMVSPLVMMRMNRHIEDHTPRYNVTYSISDV